MENRRTWHRAWVVETVSQFYTNSYGEPTLSSCHLAPLHKLSFLKIPTIYSLFNILRGLKGHFSIPVATTFMYEWRPNYSGLKVVFFSWLMSRFPAGPIRSANSKWRIRRQSRSDNRQTDRQTKKRTNERTSKQTKKHAKQSMIDEGDAENLLSQWAPPSSYHFAVGDNHHNKAAILRPYDWYL